MRLIHTTPTHNEQFAKVYYDKEWEEYRVRFYKKGILVKNADSHTSDKDDAISTAEHVVKETVLVLSN
jgi:hypothetical protein